MSVTTAIKRHELPTGPGEFTIDCHGLNPFHMQVERDVPVIYTVGCISSDDDGNEPWPHKFRWMRTDEPWPERMNLTEYCGTVQLPNGIVQHLFRIYE